MGYVKDNLREYNRIHKWISRHYIKSGICEFCFKTCKTHWSNKSGKYSQERIDWQELCPKCHRKYDIDVLGLVAWEKPYKYPPSRLKKTKEFRDCIWDDKVSLLERLEGYGWFKA
jgi:hypothetical protein